MMIVDTTNNRELQVERLPAYEIHMSEDGPSRLHNLGTLYSIMEAFFDG